MGRTSDARERIVDSAMQLIHARSAGAVGVQEICARAGVKKGSFYHFFDSKQDLIVAALEAHWLMAKREVWAPALDTKRAPLARIDALVAAIHAQARKMVRQTGQFYGCGMGNLAAEVSTQDEAVRAAVERIFMEATLTLQGTLDEAVAAGELPPLDTMATAKALWAYLEGAMLLAKCKQDPDVIKELGETARALLERLRVG